MSFIAGYLLGLEESAAAPVIKSLTVTENKTYTAEAGVDGYSPITVKVKPNVGGKTITANGTYSASNEGLDGFDVVTVNVPPVPDPECYKKGVEDALGIVNDPTASVDVPAFGGGISLVNAFNGGSITCNGGDYNGYRIKFTISTYKTDTQYRYGYDVGCYNSNGERIAGSGWDNACYEGFVPSISWGQTEIRTGADGVKYVYIKGTHTLPSGDVFETWFNMCPVGFISGSGYSYQKEE